MKRYHAALALVGWYLISPPTIDGKVCPDLPITAWKVSRQEFSDIGKCNRIRDDYLKFLADSFHAAADKVPRSIAESIVEPKTKYTTCVPPSDPRLKRKLRGEFRLHSKLNSPRGYAAVVSPPSG